MLSGMLGMTFTVGCAPSQPPAVATAPCDEVEPPPATVAAAPPPELVAAHPLIDHARVIVEALNDGRCAELTDRFDDNMREALPEKDLVAFCTGLRADLGPVESLAVERLAPSEGRFVVVTGKGSLVLTVNVDEAGSIAGFRVTPPPPAPPAVQSAGPFGLPLEGEWFVFWGGDNLEDNKHLTHLNQRRAVDLVMRGADGKTHTGDGKKNEDYLAYGKRVLSVAPGTVVTVVDGVPDNPPGQMEDYLAVGNMVVVQHAGSEFAVYAHLVPGSLRVREGQKVKRGQVLGAVGNSGRSSEPHLHFHVQSTAPLTGALGLEAFFDQVEIQRDGAWQTVDDYRFKRGDRVRPKR